MDIKTYLKTKKEVIDAALDRYLPLETEFPPALHKAMRYSVFAGGKRLRPILVLASAEAVKGDWESAMPVACALELIHTYSLVHDDLPAMDNDDLRRGKATNHKVFGDAIAILAGDSLLSLAFDLMSQIPTGEDDKEARVVLKIIHEIARASGSMGMVGGQTVDIESQGKCIDFPLLEYIHIHKTGSLILSSIRSGAILSSANEEEIEALTRYGEAAGLAFQITDDVLDIEGSREVMGKQEGSDISKQKATYPSILGIEESKKRAEELTAIALSALDPFGDEADPLRYLARYIIDRRG